MSQRKKYLIKSEEVELFQEACDHVKLIKNDKIPLKTKTIPLKVSIPTPRLDYYYDEPETYSSAEEELHFARSGISPATLKKLKRGQIMHEAKLDLHHLRVGEALHESEAFLERCQARGFKCVLIVHGKGHYSKESKPILKSLVNEWLREQKSVLAFESSQPKHGGTGALYVLLKTL